MQVLVIASYNVPLDEIVADLESMDIKVLDVLDKIAGLVIELREDQSIDLLHKVHGIISFEEDKPVKCYETV